MRQGTTTISNIRITYLIGNESAKDTIFFIHGNSISSDSWKKQLTSDLLKKYRLIAFDLPAHGGSGTSLNPAEDYSLPGLGLIIAKAIQAVAGNDSYMIVGLSLGTNILAEALAFKLKPQGIVLAGSCIIGGKYTIDKLVRPNTNVFVVFTEKSPEAEVVKYASEVMFSNDENYVKEFIKDYYGVKSRFRALLSASIQQQKYSNEVELIARIAKPVLIIFGKDEKIIDPDYLDNAPFNLWNKVYKIPGAGHLVNIDQPDAFNKLVSIYAREVFNNP
jgi:pimeloyl-ACP methyl ester carboxylesterase